MLCCQGGTLIEMQGKWGQGKIERMLQETGKSDPEYLELFKDLIKKSVVT